MSSVQLASDYISSFLVLDPSRIEYTPAGAIIRVTPVELSRIVTSLPTRTTQPTPSPSLPPD